MSTDKWLITGANGQLGSCAQDLFKAKGIKFVALSSSELDVTDRLQVMSQLDQIKPTVVLNAAAFTAVDKAEAEQEVATAVNVEGPGLLAEWCDINNAVLIHISTDYVFDGVSSSAYKESDSTAPMSVYGVTKLQGELLLAEKLERFLILRTSWVFSEYGNNFVKTMLRLGRDRDQLRVVNDQFGCPTYAGDIAEAAYILHLAAKQNDEGWGIYHYCGDVAVSWWEFARQIFNTAVAEGKQSVSPILNGIPTSEYPTPAVRPLFSVLDCAKAEALSVELSDWKERLRIVIPKL
ncbi:dTDP-4-dehydrorhamnose reductase [Aliamphritea ceti]|uniref:dTDP-4-dehydrorhamnose reductase n=1 Tax=Aliamphritea ceti TaxID=1524258 RepID=UPI0021C330B8|nr:dTDP-4-dehydrorhamnose reductase [Aliamphritea ceti]